MNDVLDIHTHTLASGHAYNTVNEMIQEAANKGLRLFGITEHAPAMPGSCTSLYFANLNCISRKKLDLRLLFGVELNIMDEFGTVDLKEHVLKDLDVCIASMHPPCYGASRGIKQDTEAVINAMKNPYVDMIGHPDDGRYSLDYEQIVLAAKQYNVLLEVNNSSLQVNSFRSHAKENYQTMLPLCKKYGVSVIVNSDAHVADEVGMHESALELLSLTEFPEDLVINRSADLLIDFLKSRRERSNF